MTDTRMRRTAALAVLLAVGGAILLGGVRVGAIRPMDGLHHGQGLVDAATGEIDGRVDAMRSQGLETQLLSQNIRSLVDWVHEYGAATVAPRYSLGSAEGLLITDGIADTLATRLYAVLGDYVADHPEENLGRGRQALEVALASIPLPPGRFLGFHFAHLANLYGAQTDTVLSVAPASEHAGVHEGYLRRLWDLAQLYHQVHKTNAEKYFCRIAQEDWLIQRMICEECGHRGLRWRDQRMGLREDTTAACLEVLYSTDRGPEAIRGKFNCRSYGHVFDAACPECGWEVHFNVPLPYYRELQLGIALGEKAPDLTPLIRTDQDR